MARGEKFCSKCGGRNGPRSWNCKGCGAGFLVKGTQYPDIEPGVEKPRDAVEKKITEQQLLEHFLEVAPTEKDIMAWGQKVRVWRSIDEKWMIRKRDRFYGICMDDNEPYSLLYWDETYGMWNIPKPGPYCFKKLKLAIKAYIEKIKERT